MHRWITFLILFGMVSPAWALEKKDLIGTWRLQAYYKIENGKEVPRCIDPFGIISYFSNGYMAVGINCMDPVTKGQVNPDPKEMVFYTGKFSIQAPSTVVHHVENSSDISRIGKDLLRDAKMEKDTVTLVGKGVTGQVKLVWKKVKTD